VLVDYLLEHRPSVSHAALALSLEPSRCLPLPPRRRRLLGLARISEVRDRGIDVLVPTRDRQRTRRPTGFGLHRHLN